MVIRTNVTLKMERRDSFENLVRNNVPQTEQLRIEVGKKNKVLRGGN